MTQQSMDGRRARRARNRQEVVETALALIDEGQLDPSIEQLTERSGLSARSIFRYFDGLDDLRRAVIREHFERIEPLLEGSKSEKGPLDQRIANFVESRIKINEAMSGPARTARLRAPYAPVIAKDIDRYRKVLETQVRRYFAPELKARSRAEADDLVSVIDVLVSADGWDLLVNHHSRSKSQIRRAWVRSLTQLLGRTAKV